MWFPPSYWQSSFSTDDTPTDTPGTLVAPGNSNSEGNWVEIIGDANVTFDVWELQVGVYGTASGVRRCLIDIGVDPAGGTSYSAIVSDVVCGGYGPSAILTTNHRAQLIRIPMFIKSGSAIAARIQTSISSDTGNERVFMRIFGNPSRPEITPVGQFSETIGLAGANSDGTAFDLPGSANTFSDWTELGTTAKDMWFWQLCVQNNEGTITNGDQIAQLSYGDGETNTIIVPHYRFGKANTESILPYNGNINWAYHPVPAGSTMYARHMTDGTATTGFGYVALGIGG